MKVSCEMARTAGMESTAKTKSVISMQMRHSSRGVAFLTPSTCSRHTHKKANTSKKTKKEHRTMVTKTRRGKEYGRERGKGRGEAKGRDTL